MLSRPSFRQLQLQVLSSRSVCRKISCQLIQQFSFSFSCIIAFVHCYSLSIYLFITFATQVPVQVVCRVPWYLQVMEVFKYRVFRSSPKRWPNKPSKNVHPSVHTYVRPYGQFMITVTVFGRPYYRSSLWYSVSSVVCRLSSSVTFCIVAKRCILAKKCLKEWIGNQGQKVDFFGRQ